MILYVTSAVIVFIHLWRQGVQHTPSLVIAIGVPATAAMLMVLSGVLAPSLFPSERLLPGHALVLPVCYALFTAVAATFSIQMAGGGGLAGPSPAVEVARVWLRPGFLLFCGGLQAVNLGIAILLRPRR